jgi:hypothetical protein
MSAMVAFMQMNCIGLVISIFLIRHLSLNLNGLTVDPDIQVEIGDSNINMEEI